MREKRFHSFSPTMDLRVVVLKDGARHVLMYVDHHDKRLMPGRSDGRSSGTQSPASAQLVEFEEVVREEVTYVPRPVEAPPLFAAEADDYLLGLGVPPVYLDLVRSVDEDGLLDLCQRLPEEAQEALLELAAGNRPDSAPRIAAELEPDPFEIRTPGVASGWRPTKKRSLRPWTALGRNGWSFCIRPQRFAVERNFNGPARVSGRQAPARVSSQCTARRTSPESRRAGASSLRPSPRRSLRGWRMGWTKSWGQLRSTVVASTSHICTSMDARPREFRAAVLPRG